MLPKPKKFASSAILTLHFEPIYYVNYMLDLRNTLFIRTIISFDLPLFLVTAIQTRGVGRVWAGHSPIDKNEI